MKRRRRRGEGCVYRPKGSGVYWIKYVFNGKMRYESTGKRTEAEAKETLKVKTAQKTLGQLPLPSKKTFADMEAEIIQDYKLNGRKSLDRVEFALKPLRLHFGNLKATEITSDMVGRYIIERREGKTKNATINRELAVLRKMFSVAKIPQRPEIKALAENNVRSGFLR